MLSLRELCQLDTGSALMLSNIKSEVSIAVQGGASMMEHPAPHSNEEYASTWRTSLQQTFCESAPGSQKLNFQQWKFGADVIKPTTLRLMGLPHMAMHFHALAQPDAKRPSCQLAGVDAIDGKFKTARDKEYPAHLCKAMIDTLLAGLAIRVRRQVFAERDLSQLEERDFAWLQAVTEASKRAVKANFCRTTNQMFGSCTDQCKTAQGISLAAAE